MGRAIKRKKTKSKKTKKKDEPSSSSIPAVASGPAKVWQPGVDVLEEGEELEFDPEAYNYLRGFSIGWPCLSFDIVRDQLGIVRSEFPHSFYGVAGTQAEKAAWNYIGVFKISNINGKKRAPIPASAVDGDSDEDSDSSSDDEAEEINQDTKPIVHLKKVAHAGGVNRIRSMTQKPHLCATWGDTGHVQVWDMSFFLNSLAESGTDAHNEEDIIHKHLPLKVFSGHKDEGYAIDWSPLVTGRLVSGVFLIESISRGAPPPAATGGYRGPTPPQGPFGTAPPSQGPFAAGASPQGTFTSAPPSQGPFAATAPPQVPFTSAPPSQGPFTSRPPSQAPFASAPPSKAAFASVSLPQGPFAAGPPPQGPFATTPAPFRAPPSSLVQPQSPTGSAVPPPPLYVRPPPPVQLQPPPMQGYYPGAPPANPQFPVSRPGFQQPVQTMPPPTMGPPAAFGNQAAYPTAGPPVGGTLQSLVEDFQSLSLSSVPGSLDPGVDVKGLPRPLDGDEEPVKVLESYPLNCHSRYFRLTTHAIPASQSLFTRWHLPLGAVVHPLAESPDGEEVSVINFGAAGVIRCRRCRTYINPYVTFADAGRKWRCNLCTLLNDVPGEYFCALDASGRRYDTDQRPELSKGTVEFVAPTEYMVRPPMPPSYFFLIDVSVSAVRSGLLEVVAKTIKSCLDKLPGFPRTQIGFLTFDSTLHFHNFKSSLSQPQMMVVADLDDVFLPLPDDLLVNLVDSRHVVESFLDSLPSMFHDNVNVESALGPALKATFMVMSQIGGKLLVFQSTLPSLGIGRLRLRGDDVRAYGTDKEHTLRVPEDPFYKQMAAEFTKNQIAVDIFSCSEKYSDIASLGSLAKYTGGQVYHYPSFQAATHGDKLKHELSRDLTRETAWESVMRIRCGKGIRFTTYHGHFMLRSTDLLALPAVDSDKAFGMQLSLEETLMTTQTVYFQVALLYTSSSGERRIRVHTAAAPVVTDLSEMYRQANTGAIVSLLGRIAVENSLSDKLDSVRQQLQLKLVRSLKEYRNLYVVQHRIGGRLIYPESLRFLPLYILAICKSLALRGGYADVSLDERCAAGFSMMILPVKKLLNFIYPSLYRVDEALTMEPDGIDVSLKRLPLTMQCLDTGGMYLLDDGFDFLVWLGRMLPPEHVNNILGVSLANFPDLSKIQLRECDNEYSRKFMKTLRALQEKDPSYYQLCRVVRQGEQPREGFLLLSNLVEDQMAGTSSYVDWILQIHRQTQS